MKKKTNPVWGGRFKGKSSSLLEEVNNSIHFDHNLVMEDLKLCMAYSESLLSANIINKKENNRVQKALLKIQLEVYQGKIKFLDEYEDIHMNIEMMLKKKNRKVGG